MNRVAAKSPAAATSTEKPASQHGFVIVDGQHPLGPDLRGATKEGEATALTASAGMKRLNVVPWPGSL